MSVWNKNQLDTAKVESIQKKFNIDALTASIFVRRGIIEGKDILYYMEEDLRFQHNPFLFSSMEDVVERILSAAEEKEKVLIFGDRDVDGISATTVLFDCLKSLGIDVRYRLPSGDDAYGLSMAAVDDFAKDYGSLIITVDCGISNNQEIAHAGDLGLDVIVLDHHNPPASLPAPALIIDPKLSDSGYPFKDISGCAVVYKVVSAIRFTRSSWYNQEIALLDLTETDGSFSVNCIKVKNLIPVARLSETVEGITAISETKLESFLRGQLIFVWNENRVRQLLQKAFGVSAEFNLVDAQTLIPKVIPQVAKMELSKIKELSKIAHYGNHAPTEIGGFYNIFVSFVQQELKIQHPEFVLQEEKDLQLVALAALADIMPMQNENRLFVKQALQSINAKRIRPGLLELMSKLNLLGKRVSSTDLSWVIVSHLNAAGRLGHPELGAELFLTQDEEKRFAVAKKIQELNVERKQLSVDAWNYASIQAKSSIPKHNGKLCVVIDSRINRGVSGILAGRLVQTYDVPAMAVTFVDENAIGSMRSCRGYDVTAFLDKFGDIFLNHGGHNFAAGFSLKKERLKEFEQKVQELSAEITLSESHEGIFEVDAEIPANYLTPALLSVSDRFEPFGEENASLCFMTKNVPILDAFVMGKGEKQHLKITIGSGKYKWPCLFWNEGERLHRDFEVGDNVDILFHIERNSFNGTETPQLILADIRKC